MQRAQPEQAQEERALEIFRLRRELRRLAVAQRRAGGVVQPLAPQARAAQRGARRGLERPAAVALAGLALERGVELVPALFTLEQRVEHEARAAISGPLGEQHHELLAGLLEAVAAAVHAAERAQDAGPLVFIGVGERVGDERVGGRRVAGEQRDAGDRRGEPRGERRLARGADELLEGAARRALLQQARGDRQVHVDHEPGLVAGRRCGHRAGVLRL